MHEPRRHSLPTYDHGSLTHTYQFNELQLYLTLILVDFIAIEYTIGYYCHNTKFISLFIFSHKYNVLSFYADFFIIAILASIQHRVYILSFSTRTFFLNIVTPITTKTHRTEIQNHGELYT